MLPEEVTLKLRPRRKKLARSRAGRELVAGQGGTGEGQRRDQGGEEQHCGRREGLKMSQTGQLGLGGTSGSLQRKELWMLFKVCWESLGGFQQKVM